MENGKTNSDLLRLIGFMTVCVGIAWAVQTLGFSQEATLTGRLLWTIAAAAVSGAGVGLVLTAGSMPEAEAIPVKA